MTIKQAKCMIRKMKQFAKYPTCEPILCVTEGISHPWSTILFEASGSLDHPTTDTSLRPPAEPISALLPAAKEWR